MSKKNPRNVQVLLTEAQFAWMQSLGNGSAPAGIRRLLEIVAQESQPDPLATLGALLGRAAAVHAIVTRSHPAPPTPAGSTAAPIQAAPLYKEGAAPGQPAAPAADGFEGWDE